MKKAAVLTLFIVFIFSATVSAQEESKAVEKRKEQLERQEEEKKRLAEEAHEEGVRKHMQIQTRNAKAYEKEPTSGAKKQ